MKVQVGVLYEVSRTENGTHGIVRDVLPANGRRFTLDELQKYVNGPIELVPGSRPDAYCNDEGRLTNLPGNILASAKFKQLLVGNVIQIFNKVVPNA